MVAIALRVMQFLSRAFLFRRLNSVVGCLALLCAWACSGAEPGEGADFLLRVETGQLTRAAFPEVEGGPEVTFADFRRNSVRPGEGRVPFSGRAENSTFSVRVGLRGDVGYWIVPVGVEDPAVKGELTWETFLDFSETIQGSSVELFVQAVDEQGRGGPLTTFVIPMDSTQPQGSLAVRLEWDANADVDLWVEDPRGVSLSPKNLSNASSGTPGNPPSGDWGFAFIDIDSNSNCQIDGMRQETAIWDHTPPDGTYQVGVDLASPCATHRTSFWVSIWIDGQLQTRASGVLYPFDSRMTASGAGFPIPVVSFALKDGQLRLEP